MATKMLTDCLEFLVVHGPASNQTIAEFLNRWGTSTTPQQVGKVLGSACIRNPYHVQDWGPWAAGDMDAAILRGPLWLRASNLGFWYLSGDNGDELLGTAS